MIRYLSNCLQNSGYVGKMLNYIRFYIKDFNCIRFKLVKRTIIKLLIIILYYNYDYDYFFVLLECLLLFDYADNILFEL